MAVTVTQKIYKLTSDTVNRVFNCSVSVPTKGGVVYNDAPIRNDFAQADSIVLSSANSYSDAAVANIASSIENINLLLESDDTTLDELQEVVDFIKLNKSELDSLTTSNIAGLDDALTSLSNRITFLENNPYDDTSLTQRVSAVENNLLTPVPLNAVFTDTVYNDSLLAQRTTDLETSVGEIEAALITINGTY